MASSVFDIAINTLQGASLDWQPFAGKKILIVNTASYCGYTPQYAQLQELHQLHADKVAVLGVPCNDFGAQEPGNAKDIAQFCSTTYGVTFPLTEKVHCTGASMHPLYRFLTTQSLNGHSDSEVKWNFQKYLLDGNGCLMAVFASGVEPFSDEILGAIGL